MNTIQTQSPEEAAKTLFEQALPLVPISELGRIQQEYQGFVNAWGARELISGSKADLQKRVLDNLRRTISEPGFHYFTIDVREQMGLAQVISWSDGNGASVCLWKASDSCYLCGNYFFS